MTDSVDGIRVEWYQMQEVKIPIGAEYGETGGGWAPKMATTRELVAVHEGVVEADYGDYRARYVRVRFDDGGVMDGETVIFLGDEDKRQGPKIGELAWL